MDDTQLALAARVGDVITHVRYPEYTFLIGPVHGGVALRASYKERDVLSGKMSEQLTRKWLLSPYMTNSEIVQTAFKCILTSMEHRAREHFQYKGQRIFGPHFDVEDLVVLCRDGRSDAGGRNDTGDEPEPAQNMQPALPPTPELGWPFPTRR
jgi:hypothetical protein